MANSEDRKDSVIMDEIDEKERSGQTEQSEQTKQAEQGDECADQTTEQTEKPAGQETPEGGLRIQLDAMRAMSLPLLTAGYPLIRQIVLENQGKAAVTGLRLRVVSPEGFFQPWERDLPAIPADTALPAEIPALVFDAQKMAELTEPAAGFIRAEVVSGGAGDKGNETIRAESASGDANVTGNGAARVESVSGDTNGTGTGTIRSKSAFGGTGNAEAADEKVLCAAEAEVKGRRAASDLDGRRDDGRVPERGSGPRHPPGLRAVCRSAGSWNPLHSFRTGTRRSAAAGSVCRSDTSGACRQLP